MWLRPDQLPEDWMAYPHPESTQAIGDRWVNSGETPGLAVLSVLAPQESNPVLNPMHPTLRICRSKSRKYFRLILGLETADC